MEYLTRCSPQRFFRVVRELSLAKREAVRELGFGGLLNIKGIPLRRILCGWLVARCDSQSKTIKIGEQDVPVTAWDVHCIMGLPHEGEPIELRDDVYIEPHLLAYYNVKGRHIPVTYLESLIKDSEHPDDDFKRTFVLFAIATLLAPKCRLEISDQYLPLVADTKCISNYAWARYIVDYLFLEIGKVKEGGNKWMQGCLVLLQYWYYEHVRLPGAPFDFESRTYPLLAHWDEKRCQERDQYEGINGGYGKGELRILLTLPVDEEPLNQELWIPNERHANSTPKGKKRKMQARRRKIHIEEEGHTDETLRTLEAPTNRSGSPQLRDVVTRLTTLIHMVGNMDKHMAAMGKQMAKQTKLLEEISRKLDCKDQAFKPSDSARDLTYDNTLVVYAEGGSSFLPPHETNDVPNGLHSLIK